MFPPGVTPKTTVYRPQAHNSGVFTLVPAEEGKVPVAVVNIRNGLVGGTLAENTAIQSGTTTTTLLRFGLSGEGPNAPPAGPFLIVGVRGESIEIAIAGGPTGGFAYVNITYGYMN